MLGSGLFTEDGRGRLLGNWSRGGLRAGWDASFRGAAIFNIPMAAFSAASAPRGHAISAGVEGLTMGAGALLGGMMFGLPGAIVGGIVADSSISRAIAKPFQILHDYERNFRRLRMGGDYQDSAQAFTMRQAAVKEMSGSLLNARAWLGHEGRAMHA